MGGKGRDEVKRRLARGAVMAPARGLAVEGDQGGRVRPKLARPAHEASRKQPGIHAVHRDVQPPRPWNAVVAGQKAAQEWQMVLAPGGDIVEIIVGSDGCASDQKQHLGQRMGDPPCLARVFDLRKMVQQAAKARFRAEIVHREGSPNQKARWNHATRNC